ncbi:hypothetical protein EZI54_07270 [Marinobacter halodurans]|uniref:DotA/TraY family protein n=1 Tax=Marinobacter halodurans TaxID=2528979 RepID=A0ABY1ZMI6_9GAMM|nr:DotA/TraY family protein [Marinobacter halodurans]TBW57452.1 hypothetical protein EZI54_07270 [Marinobacter halodurans]
MKSNQYLRFLAVPLLLAFSGSAFSATQDPTQGFGAWLIAALFESGSIGAPPSQPGLIGTVSEPIGMMSMLIAAILIITKSTQHLLVVAQAKDVDESPVSMTWAPIHIALAVFLIMPTPSGYSAGQHAAIWVAEQSNTLGNIVAQRLTNFFKTNGSITPVTNPSMKPAVNALISSALCRETIEQLGEPVAAEGGTPLTVTTKSLGSSADNPYAVFPLDEFDTQTVLNYVRDPGDNYSLPGGENKPFCGGLSVSYRTAFGASDRGDTEQSDQTVDSLFQGNDAEMPEWSLDSLNDFNNSGTNNQILDIASSANAQLSRYAQRMATNHNGPTAIAQNLLFDLRQHIEATRSADPEKIKALSELLKKQEDNYINKAAKMTVQLYKDSARQVYSYYASARNNQRDEDGENWADALDKVGWPGVGLYWMQFSYTSNRVNEAVDVQMTPVLAQGRPSSISNMMMDDPSLRYRLANRMARYHEAVAREIAKDPLVPNSGADDLEQKKLAFDQATNDFQDDLITTLRNAGTEESSDGNVVTNFFINFFRDKVFPFIVGSLKTSDNALIGLINLGHFITDVGEVGYMADKAFEGLMGAAKYNQNAGVMDTIESGVINAGMLAVSGGSWAGKMASDTALGGIMHTVMGSYMLHPLLLVAKDLISYMALLIIPGLFLAFYLPGIIMIQWLTQLVSWLIYTVESVIVVPVWGVLFVGDMGQKAIAPQTARQGFVHFLSILLYPALMVIGFVIGLKVTDITSTFMIDFLMIGFINATDGYAFGIVSSVAGLVLVAFATYQILMRIFSLMMELNDRAISWIGQRQSYQEGMTENATRSGIVGVLNKGEGKTKENKQERKDSDRRKNKDDNSYQ